MFISGNEPDVILITEVLPKVHSQFVTKARLSLPGYSAFTNFNFESPSAYHGIRGQDHRQKIFLGSAFEEKVELLILYMYHSPGAVEEFIIVGCMLIAHIYERLYLHF